MRKAETLPVAVMDIDGNVHVVEIPQDAHPADGDAVIDSLIAERPELGRTDLTDEDCATLRALGADLTPEEEARSVRGLSTILERRTAEEKANE